MKISLDFTPDELTQLNTLIGAGSVPTPTGSERSVTYGSVEHGTFAVQTVDNPLGNLLLNKHDRAVARALLDPTLGAYNCEYDNLALVDAHLGCVNNCSEVLEAMHEYASKHPEAIAHDFWVYYYQRLCSVKVQSALLFSTTDSYTINSVWRLLSMAESPLLIPALLLLHSDDLDKEEIAEAVLALLYKQYC